MDIKKRRRKKQMIIGGDRTENSRAEETRAREYEGESDIVKDRTVGQIKAKDRAKKKRRDERLNMSTRVDLMDIKNKEEVCVYETCCVYSNFHIFVTTVCTCVFITEYCSDLFPTAAYFFNHMSLCVFL